jgi:uncharacterized integral membrane protein (TIGR00698 family)
MFAQDKISDTMNGILISLLFAMSAMYIGNTPFFIKSGISPLIVAIFMGVIYANTLRHKLPSDWIPGIQFTAKQVLRAAIVLFGFRLSFGDIINLGWQTIVFDAGVVASTLLISVYVGTKFLKLDKDASLLIGSGSAICGAAAVMATDGTLRNVESYKAAAAIATVVLFGSISMVLYPFLYEHGWLAMSVRQYGIWSGSTIHEVAQVVAAGNVVNTNAAADAVLVKMGRVLLLAPALIAMGCLVNKCAKNTCSTDTKKTPKQPVVPAFILYFIAAVAINSMHIVPEALVKPINQLDQFLLVSAMAALGIETTWAKMKLAGTRSFILAGILFIWLSVGGFFAVKFFFQ